MPVEIQESRNPVLIERFGLIPDSAGPGRARGGCGMRRDLRLLADSAVLYDLGDRNRTAPYGLFGGEAGAKGATILNPDRDDAQPLHSKGTYRLKAGDLVSWRTAGAGGYGPPAERLPARVLVDVKEGLVSPAAAAERYRVVIDTSGGMVDEAATAQLRSR